MECNFEHLYNQTKYMLEKYQDEIIPAFRELFVRGQKPVVTFGFDPDNVTPSDIPEELADKFVNREATCREITG